MLSVVIQSSLGPLGASARATSHGARDSDRSHRDVQRVDCLPWPLEALKISILLQMYVDIYIYNIYNTYIYDI